MKHLLNNLSEEEKNSIRGQHTGGMKVSNERFNSLLENKLGNAKPLVEQFDNSDANEFSLDSEELGEDTSWMDELDEEYDNDYAPTLKEKIESAIRNSVTNKDEIIDVLEAILREKKGHGHVTKDKVRKHWMNELDDDLNEETTGNPVAAGAAAGAAAVGHKPNVPTTGQGVKNITPNIQIDCNRQVIVTSELPKLDKKANYDIINYYCSK